MKIMNKIEWKPEYSVDIPRLDEQHQKIIRVINSLIDNPGVFDNSDTVSRALTELTNYVSEHFLLEEQILEKNSYPNLLEHANLHTMYGDRVAKFYIDLIGKKKGTAEELLNFLKKWWIGHILHEDMKYKEYFTGKNIT